MKLAIYLIIIVMTSCKTYEIATVKSEDVNLSSNQYVFENDTIAIHYEFWQENGNMTFDIFNKTKKPIYINWKNSAYIDNGQKMAYWVDGSKSQSYGRTAYLGYGLTSGSGKTVTIRDEQITSIPPNSRVQKITFVIYKTYNVPVPTKKLKNEALFDKISSPIKFRNYIAYSFTEDFAHTTFVDNDFYVSSLHAAKGNDYNKYKSPANFYMTEKQR